MDLIEIFYNHFPKISSQQIVLFLFLSIILTAVLVFTVRKKIIKSGQAVCVAGVFVWLFIVFLSTVFSRNPYPEMKYELMPFWSYAYTLQYHSVSMAEEIFLNVLLLMPMGVLLYAAFGRRIDYKNRGSRVCSVVLYRVFTISAETRTFLSGMT